MTNQLTANQQLNVNDHLEPSNNTTHLIMQGDGNLVLYRSDNGRALWATNTWSSPVNHAVMQGDGNFVCYDAGGRPYWATCTDGHPGAYITLQDDGNLVLYDPSNTPLWASNTAQSWPVAGNLVPKFPITASQDDNFPGSGGFMHSDVTVYASGLLNAVTHTWEVTDLRGFKGVVAAAVLDQNKTPLWVSSTHQCGVDGRWIGVSDRTDNWSEQIPAAILPNVRYIAIIQKWNPNGVYNDIQIWLKGITDIGSALGGAIKVVERIIALL